MASYFAKVELHGASWPDEYQYLHARLAMIGFANCMFVIDGQTPVNRQLPTGFYFCSESNANHTTITASVKKAADAAGFSSDIGVITSVLAISCLTEDCVLSPMKSGLRKALAGIPPSR
jgi:hypothetical protein